MPLFRYQCEQCKEVTRKLLPTRPTLGPCHCGGKLSFSTDTQAMVKETLDNGVMPRKVERLKDIEEMVQERGQEKKDPGLV